ncbi:hypothetical protein EYF80_060922 [Liparis tanakae]|uniref:Uncharacterized protein n=1 Tax=Liparis tanakae TaxID=230148 RepID=A0A4Z2EK17_9TELE|nr:hypothetical protein EYF80_060922 [Liparis tanakae]
MPPSFFLFLFTAKTDEVLKAKVAKREEEARKALEEGQPDDAMVGKKGNE